MSRRLPGGLALWLALGSWTAVSGQTTPPVFHSEVEAVYLDVVVTRSGRPVPGLLASDFELEDDGVPQRLELLSAETRPLLAVLVFDTSSSMEGERLDALRTAAAAFLDGIRPGDRAGLVTFSEEITWRAEPTADRDALRRALAGLSAGGATSLYDALFTALTLTDAGSRPLIVLFTDGEDNLSWLGERQLRSVAERSDAVIHVVSWLLPPAIVHGLPRTPPVESEQDRALREIAELTGGRAWRADSPGRLREAFAGIADAMGHRYVLRFEPRAADRRGLHRVEVRLRAGKGEIHARRGYWLPPRREPQGEAGQRGPKR